jgi:hypothetical protein
MLEFLVKSCQNFENTYMLLREKKNCKDLGVWSEFNEIYKNINVWIFENSLYIYKTGVRILRILIGFNENF